MDDAPMNDEQLPLPGTEPEPPARPALVTIDFNDNTGGDGEPVLIGRLLINERGSAMLVDAEGRESAQSMLRITRIADQLRATADARPEGERVLTALVQALVIRIAFDRLAEPSA